MIKMVISDMDGTLLNSDKNISAENKKAIRLLEEKKTKFLLATGRIYASAASHAKDLGLDTPIIACNGALIKNPVTKERLYEKVIEKSLAEKVMEIFEEEGIYYHFYTERDFYTKELKYTSIAYLHPDRSMPEEEQLRLVVQKDMFFSLEEAGKAMKFVAIDDDRSRVEKVKLRLEDLSGIEISQSWHNNLEIMAEGISKGKALQKIADHYGIQERHILTLGDHFNDIPMIRQAGYGIAMGNAEAEVKRSAVYVTDTNDNDGFAKAIWHYSDLLSAY